MVHQAAALVRNEGQETAGIRHVGAGLVTGNLVHNRSLRVLHDAVAQHPERAFIAVRIALNPLTAAYAQPVALARLWLRPVLEAVEVRHLRVEQLLGEWRDLLLARSRRCRGAVHDAEDERREDKS